MEKFYLPILKLKQAEYKALYMLEDNEKGFVIPLLELPPIPYDHEEEKVYESLKDQLSKSAKYVKKYWAKRTMFIDTCIIPEHILIDKKFPMIFFFDELSEEADYAIPVLPLNKNAASEQSVSSLIEKKRVDQICIRVSLDDFISDDFYKSLDGTIKKLKIAKSAVHFVLDLKTPENLSDIEGFSLLIIDLIENLPDAEQYASLTVAATAFPKSMAEVKRPSDVIVRKEWLLYSEIIKSESLDHLSVNFGDYGIEKSDYVEYNPVIMRGSAAIRYTNGNSWFITKGLQLKERASYAQFIDQSKVIHKSDFFYGEDYSEGDRMLAKYATGKAKGTGNASIWKQIGFNHHFTVVVNDLLAIANDT